jgi:hypothetical protein
MTSDPMGSIPMGSKEEQTRKYLVSVRAVVCKLITSTGACNKLTVRDSVCVCAARAMRF